ncbi:hypothetical protein F5X68DRAFT_13281 [Plectosphaerella plurivora]|uniref:Uncharacterized protein n=1 Tax=Plectosphaerella plurivora TaxID=936078 RepID=A0A9P8VB09_9PEZI|nr:hypothetical protein F5X68DRAFT_13281 [Plectosphaerella plurivora]
MGNDVSVQVRPTGREPGRLVLESPIQSKACFLWQLRQPADHVSPRSIMATLVLSHPHRDDEEGTSSGMIPGLATSDCPKLLGCARRKSFFVTGNMTSFGGHPAKRFAPNAPLRQRHPPRQHPPSSSPPSGCSPVCDHAIPTLAWWQVFRCFCLFSRSSPTASRRTDQKRRLNQQDMPPPRSFCRGHYQPLPFCSSLFHYCAAAT